MPVSVGSTAAMSVQPVDGTRVHVMSASAVKRILTMDDRLQKVTIPPVSRRTNGFR
jgi:predicted nucleic acid-binding protein